MKAIQILGDPTAPRVAPNNSMPKPTLKASEILLRVHAAGITGDEVLWPEVYQTASRIPGHDVSGTIEELGPDYQGPLKVGQDIVALIAADRGEGQAEYAVCKDDEIASKPPSVTHAEAAALPIPMLTAFEAIIEHGKVRPGMNVLITGASGAVGIIAVQIAAKTVGANVIALASSQNHHKLGQLGATETVDYNESGWEGRMKQVDVVFDTVGGDILRKTWDTVKGDGTIITVGDPPPSWAFGRGQAVEAAAHPGVRYMHFIVQQNSQKLTRALQMIDSGSVKALAVETFPFEEGETAWARARQRGRGRKIVLMF